MTNSNQFEKIKSTRGRKKREDVEQILWQHSTGWTLSSEPMNFIVSKVKLNSSDKTISTNQTFYTELSDAILAICAKISKEEAEDLRDLINKYEAVKNELVNKFALA